MDSRNSCMVLVQLQFCSPRGWGEWGGGWGGALYRYGELVFDRHLTCMYERSKNGYVLPSGMKMDKDFSILAFKKGGNLRFRSEKWVRVAFPVHGKNVGSVPPPDWGISVTQSAINLVAHL